MKKHYNLYLSINKIEPLKEEGINISRLIDNALSDISEQKPLIRRIAELEEQNKQMKWAIKRLQR